MTTPTLGKTMDSLEEQSKLSMKNKEEISKHPEASCYQCVSTFDAARISAWCDGGLTPICPRCGVDAVVPGRREREELARWHRDSFATYVTSEELRDREWKRGK